MQSITLEINGKKISREVKDDTLLSSFLRENLSLTGTHIGCDTSQCGACVVHVDGKSLKSCTALAAERLMAREYKQSKVFPQMVNYTQCRKLLKNCTVCNVDFVLLEW